MRDKKAQMGNMMHLVIIVVILLIAALAIILLVSNNVDQVGTESQAKNKKSFGGIGTVLGGIGISCPGHATGSTEPVAECVEHNTKIRAEENKYDEIVFLKFNSLIFLYQKL
ncbi:MAG: hypothetical protein B6U87_03255 [Candidatus Aenigmarchaeota archaeon ex4484_52]|nr:MAG: hypothetical protein B6U87_03255 [Candidatus Aenigmarchaeota archaeon ex4484_52]